MDATPVVIDSAAADVHEPAANTAAVVTYAALPGRKHLLSGFAWSYNAAPTGGALTISDGGVNVFSISITSAGPGVVLFPYPKRFASNSAVVVTLAAGGAAVTGKLSVINHWVE